MNLESDEEEIVIQKKVPKSPSSPSITVDASVTPKTSRRRVVQPDLPVYTGSNAEKDFENLAQSFDYKVVQVKGDGNCLFRSVSKSLKLNLNIKYNHKELRQMVVDYLKNNTEILDLYLEYVTSSGETTPEEHQKNVKKYIKNMEDNIPKKEKYTPIILFAYNRPWHTEEVLKALINNHNFNETRVIIISDGCKKIDDIEEECMEEKNTVNHVIQSPL